MSKWESLYIYCHNIEFQEKLMMELEPILDRMTEGWFFIKYCRGGPHIRLRFHDSGENIKEEIEGAVDKFFENNKVDNLDRDIYYSRISFDGKEEDSSKLPWHESGTCFYEDYIPEYERYGDGKLMEISENIFYHSSRLALSIFKNVKGINKRIVLSSYIIYKLLCYNNGLTLDFLNSYQTYWKKMVINEPKIKKEVICSVFDSIEKGRIDLSFMDNELEEMCNGFGKMRELTTDMERLYITSSQIHMMNNRISVTPDFEYIITREMGEWLGEKMENSKG